MVYSVECSWLEGRKHKGGGCEKELEALGGQTDQRYYKYTILCGQFCFWKSAMILISDGLHSHNKNVYMHLYVYVKD